MIYGIIGLTFIVVATALFAFAAKATKSPDSPAFTHHYMFVATIPLAVTSLLVLGIAMSWKFAAGYGGTLGWIVGVGAILLIAVLFWLFWRLFEVNKPAAAATREAPLKRAA